MKVNTKVRYGLRAILQIADSYGGDPVPISAISESPKVRETVFFFLAPPLFFLEVAALAASESAFFSASRFARAISCSNFVLVVRSSAMSSESSSLFFSTNPVMSF